ncbi:MAG: DMT family transporter [Bacteroidota bacterium]|jgi:drug/metabolite transporter (DMT)-like permease
MRDLKGYLSISAAAILWGIAATVAKFFFNRHYEPLILVQMRVSIAFVILFTYFLFKNPEVLRFRLKDIPHVLIVGVLGVAGSNYFYYAAIKETNVSTAILVQYTAPIMVMLYAAGFQKEKLFASKVTALVLSISGIFLAIGAYNPDIIKANGYGIILALLAAVSFSIFNVSGKELTKKYSVWTGLIYFLGAATVFWSFINNPVQIVDAHYTNEDWGVFAVISVISILLPYSLYYFGLLHVQSSKAIIISTLEPVVAIISEWLFLEGSMGLIQIFGAVLVISAIVILQRSTSERQPIVIQE